MAYLIVREAGKEPIRHQLTGATTIGRAWDCDIYVNDLALSRQHCCVEPVDADKTSWVVLDLHSRNGTHMNHERIVRHSLRDGETLQIGRATVQFHAAGYVPTRPESPPDESPSPPHEPLPDHVAARRADRPTRVLPVVVDPSQRERAGPTSKFRRKSDASGTVPFQRDPARPFVHDLTVDLDVEPEKGLAIGRWTVAAALILVAVMLGWWMLHR